MWELNEIIINCLVKSDIQLMSFPLHEAFPEPLLPAIEMLLPFYFHTVVFLWVYYNI